MLKYLLQHNILTNLTFLLILGIGLSAYQNLPKQQDPTVNFNWISILTTLPGASASEVERSVTDVLEDEIKGVADVKFVSSNSRPGVSTILIRLNDVNKRTFDKRMSDIHRVISNKATELPQAANFPAIIEITSANNLPSATILVTGDNSNLLHDMSRVIQQRLEQIPAVDRVGAKGHQEPELKVLFDPEKLISLGVAPSVIAETVNAYFRDVSAGSISVGNENWLVQLTGTDNDPQYLSNIPVLSPQGEVPLRSVASIIYGRKTADIMVHYNDTPAVMLDVFNKGDANVLDMVNEINQYIEEFNNTKAGSGLKLVLLHDQTAPTHKALTVMHKNALLGLILVMLTTWIFLGFKMAFFTSIGIPLTLAGTFIVLSAMGHTLNVVVLLGIVISLGMLVDDAVVVVEAIYHRLRTSKDRVQSILDAMREVIPPVTTSVLTTIAAFLPLMLLPGVLGKYMMVAPLVVSTALLVSLIEAYWILPSHIANARINLGQGSRIQNTREQLTNKIRKFYLNYLFTVFRKPKIIIYVSSALLLLSALAISVGVVRVSFFSTDAPQLFYINIEMSPGTNLERTLETTLFIEQTAKQQILPGEVNNVASYAGFRYTDKEPLIGNHYGQIAISLQAEQSKIRSTEKLIEAIRAKISAIPGPTHISFLRKMPGPPASSPVSVKIIGDNETALREAAKSVIQIIKDIEGVQDIIDDDAQGRMELALRLNPDAVLQAKLDPVSLAKDIRLFADGEIVARMQDQGERLNVRVQAQTHLYENIDGFMRNNIGLAEGGSIAISKLLSHETIRSKGNIRHYNFRRAITVEANIDKSMTNSLEVNNMIKSQWVKKHAHFFPDIDLDFSGELDDITESLRALPLLLLFGLGLIYLILGTLFKSYVQPLIVLATVPMAFIGVILGLIISNNPLSLYTLYGMVALAGIAVNASIVFIYAANTNIASGQTILQATIHAARRRVIPILITSTTTVAGLFSLAVGLGGKSMLWTPLASSIIWGLCISTLLTLFVTPPLYYALARYTAQKEELFFSEPVTPKAHDILGFLLGLFKKYFPDEKNSTLLDFAVPEISKINQQLSEIKNNPELEILYTAGKRQLALENYEEAIRQYEAAAKKAGQNGVLNLCAAQALILHMQKAGWDDGYIVRARVYLDRAKRILPNAKEVLLLEDAYDELNQGHP